MSIITRPGFRVAKCGHEYATEAQQGRQRLVGDCECTPPRKVSKYEPKVPSLHVIVCSYCDESFEILLKSGRKPLYCGVDCRNKASYYRRKASGRLYKRECSIDDCTRKVYSRGLCSTHEKRLRVWGSLDKPPKSECEQCSVVFQPFHIGARFCSRKCQRKNYGSESKSSFCSEDGCDRPMRARGLCSMHYKRQARAEGRYKDEPWSDRRRANYHKRRALKRKLPADDIRPLEVYERDGWVCRICGDLVDKSLKWPDPMSPSLDHVKPLSKGGHHVLSNVQLAHLECNVRKGDEFSLRVDEMSA